MSFKQIGKLLPRQLRQAGIERGVRAAQVLMEANEVLDEIFGPGTAANAARAAVYECKTLKIATTDASLKNAIIFRRQEIINAVNKRIKEDCVQRLQVVI